jgi:hypothetical protein
VVSLPLGACEKKEPPRAETPPASSAPPPPTSVPSPASAPASAASAAPADRVHWTDPDTWQRAQSPSPMRKATYTIPKAAGDSEDAELAVFYFGPNSGGGIDANLERWSKQFSNVDPKQVKRDDRSTHGMVQHLVEISSGTYEGGMGMGAASGAKQNFGLLGAIVETPVGNYFFKLTGPKKTVTGAKKKFLGLLDSIQTS